MLHQASLVNLFDEDDEMMPPPSKTQKMSSNASSTARTTNVKGPMNLCYPQTSKGKGSSSTTAIDASKKSLRDCGCSVFLVSVDASDESMNSTKMFNLFEKTIKQIGPENVIQVVTDNATKNVKAGDMMMGVYPHIYWTPCAAHYINLINKAIVVEHDEKIYKPKKFGETLKTRFATAFLTLQALYMQKKNLRTMIFSTEWTESRFAKEILGKEVVRHLTSTSFWNDVVRALKVGSPLIVALRLVDGEKKPSMGYIYKAMDRAKEAIEKGFHGDRK
ncbi:uncharacterized protein LOC132044338 [Lycium ferocissimum]|uniref:uncharacterized protein LOC132044338 n=1 Tax=Lycium ferocissimum TaxID=112874 RepID=UPI0028168045|nr:uncharacterized protein LOC132044338 [Lycium ferocissimum]